MLLAIRAGLLTFVPTLGPLLAGIVIVLAGLAQSGTMALYGLCTYVLVRFLESHHHADRAASNHPYTARNHLRGCS